MVLTSEEIYLWLVNKMEVSSSGNTKINLNIESLSKLINKKNMFLWEILCKHFVNKNQAAKMRATLKKHSLLDENGQLVEPIKVKTIIEKLVLLKKLSSNESILRSLNEQLDKKLNDYQQLQHNINELKAKIELSKREKTLNNIYKLVCSNINNTINICHLEIDSLTKTCKEIDKKLLQFHDYLNDENAMNRFSPIDQNAIKTIVDKIKYDKYSPPTTISSSSEYFKYRYGIFDPIVEECELEFIGMMIMKSCQTNESKNSSYQKYSIDLNEIDKLSNYSSTIKNIKAISKSVVNRTSFFKNHSFNVFDSMPKIDCSFGEINQSCSDLILIIERIHSNQTKLDSFICDVPQNNVCGTNENEIKLTIVSNNESTDIKKNVIELLKSSFANIISHIDSQFGLKYCNNLENEMHDKFESSAESFNKELHIKIKSNKDYSYFTDIMNEYGLLLEENKLCDLVFRDKYFKKYDKVQK